MKDIEGSDLISTRYLSEIDEVLVSTLNLCPSSALGAFVILNLSGALVVRHLIIRDWILFASGGALAIHGLIFRFTCDDVQQKTLHLLFGSFLLITVTPLFDFFSNPRRSQHHAVDDRMHNSITERCFSYILNRRLTHFPGIHHWASKSKRRPWLWAYRNLRVTCDHLRVACPQVIADSPLCSQVSRRCHAYVTHQ